MPAPALVFVPDPVHPDAVALLSQHAEVAQGYGPKARTLDDVRDRVAGILVRTGALDAPSIHGAPRLRVIARHGAGTDNIDLNAATAAGVLVVNAPDSNTISVAEHTLGLIIAAARRMIEGDRAVREGTFHHRDRLTGFELAGRTLGVVGLGRIGRRVARMAGLGLGMEVVGYDPVLDGVPEDAERVRLVPGLRDLLPESDVLTVHVPLTADTRGLIGPAELDLLPPGSLVVNAARGGVVVEEALAERIADGRVAGAGLDVFSQEPPSDDSPLLRLERCVLTPHVAAHTGEAMRRMAMDAAEAIVGVLSGVEQQNVVNRAVLSGTASQHYQP